MHGLTAMIGVCLLALSCGMWLQHFVNAVLAKHKRARLYDKYAPLKGLIDDDVLRMIKERKAYLKRLLTTKEGFTMEGINAGFTLQVAHLRPAISPDMQVLELQRQFVKMQWEIEEEEDD